MADIIQLGTVRQARRRQRERTYLRKCVDILEYSLRIQLDEFARAPMREKGIRAGKIRKLGELLDYTVSLI